MSVVLPCYEMGRFLGDALASIVGQTYSRWEIIAVDDCGSEDGTRGLVERYASRDTDHRIEYVRHAKNKGVSAARNTGIGLAYGELLAFLDPDDVWGPKFLVEHVHALTATGAALSYTDTRYVSESLEPLGRLLGPPPNEKRPNLVLRKYNFINPSAVVCRREEIESVGGFDESPEIQHVEDWDLWLRLLAEGMTLCYTPSAISYNRRHPRQATNQTESMRQRYIALRKKHLSDPEYQAFIASYLLEKELECSALEAQLAAGRAPTHLRGAVSRIAPRWAKAAWRMARRALRTTPAGC